MVLVKAIEHSEKGIVPSPELFDGQVTKEKTTASCGSAFTARLKSVTFPSSTSSPRPQPS